MLKPPWLWPLAVLGDSKTSIQVCWSTGFTFIYNTNALLKFCYDFFQTKAFGSGWD